jgi:histone H3/H4
VNHGQQATSSSCVNRYPAIVRRKLKKDTGLVLEKTPFLLTVREITRELHSECKWRAGALEIFQKVAEEDLVRTLSS